MQSIQKELSSFILQPDVIDAKVEVSMSRAVARVIDQIVSLRQEMHQEMGALRNEMHEMRIEFGSRLTVVETVLGIRLQKEAELRGRFLDYSFKAGWIFVFATLSGGFSLLARYLH